MHGSHTVQAHQTESNGLSRVRGGNSDSATSFVCGDTKAIQFSIRGIENSVVPNGSGRSGCECGD
ncbi:hypothetical protein GCM10007854_19700 [Algimonas porphyrae]|uniref:Uncharacterized protein n=1 Tax=Algimonas porphyrae TaxID=1128113 RepID=A0ABQ5V0D7_9PROT|nr:hypothetical protein GCM10007854_19700 [Algimonas porphyrae]